MIRRPPRSTRTDTLVPYTTLFRSVYPGGGGLKKLIEAGYVTEAPTLGELARKIGVDPAGLERTVAKMNQYSALGVDPEFGKGNEEIDREIEIGRAHV